MKNDVNLRGNRGVEKRNFCQACCEHLLCSPAQYEERVLLHCLHPHSIASAKILLRVLPFYFDWDIGFIQAVAGATDMAEFKEDLNEYRNQRRLTGILHRRMNLRVSGQRLLALAEHVFAEKAGRPSRSDVAARELAYTR